MHISELRDRINPIDAITSENYGLKALAAYHAIMAESILVALHPSTFSLDVAYQLLRTLTSDRFRDRLDCVIVTGDLATTGRDIDMALARAYFFGQLPESWLPINAAPNLMRELTCPIVTLPGNHDR